MDKYQQIKILTLSGEVCYIVNSGQDAYIPPN